MVLAESAIGPRGNVLLGEGVELTDRHIRALQTWGVSYVAVEGEEEEGIGAADLSPEELAAAAVEVAPRFRHADREEPVTAYLFDYVVRQRAIEMRGDS